MTKAILVIDMPKSCMECPFAYEYEQMYFCKTLRKITGTKKDKCPLKPMPEKISHSEIDIPTDDNFDDYWEIEGYNSCIDEILGGTDNE